MIKLQHGETVYHVTRIYSDHGVAETKFSNQKIKLKKQYYIKNIGVKPCKYLNL